MEHCDIWKGRGLTARDFSRAGKGARTFLVGLACVIALLIGAAFVPSASAFELSATDASAAANHGFSYTMSNGILTVTIPDDATYTATFEGSADSEMTIPQVVEGQSVTGLTTSIPLSTNGVVSSLKIPKTITAITSSYTLCQFTSLEDVSFHGDGEIALTTIGRLTNKSKTTVLPASLKRFNAGEVDGVYYDFVVPSSVTTLTWTACQGTAITSLYIPHSVTTTYLGNYAAFGNSPYLARVYNEADIWIPFPNCSNITDLTMTGTVSEVAANACQNWSKLESIEIPSTATSIGSNAFSGCTSLESVSIDGEELLSIGSSVFKGATSLKTLTIPDSVNFIGYGAFYNTGIEYLKLPASLWDGMTCGEGGNFNKDPVGWDIAAAYGTTYGAAMFAGGNGMQALVDSSNWNTTLKSVDLSSYQQTYIPYYMFAGCAALEEIRIPAVVQKLYEGAFADCISLDKVYIYGQNIEIAGARTSDDTGSGDTGGWVETYPSAFGYHTYPDTTDVSLWNTYSVKEGLTLYGMGYEQNDLIAYAEKYNCQFIPFAFLGNLDEAAVTDLFGYVPGTNDVSISVNGASISNMPYTGIALSPTVTVAYEDDGVASRVLEDGEDCTITYTDAAGNVLESVVDPGAYTATITGDGESVFGTYTLDFEIVYPNGLYVYPEPIEGANRYETAAAEAQSAYPDGAAGVIVATGENYPDALAVAGLSGMLDYPILLTASGTLCAEAAEAIEVLDPDTIVIVGGTGAISDAVQYDLGYLVGYKNLIRLSGSDRYATAQAIYDYGVTAAAVDSADDIEPWSATAIIATGTNYPDALSLSSYAAASTAPIFLSGADGLSDDAADAIAEDGFDSALIAGGTGVVSAAVETALVAELGEDGVVRLGGADRYETSSLAATWLVANEGMSWEGVGIATGKNYPDALAGSSLLGSTDSVLLLADTGNTDALDVLAANKDAISHIRFLGGTGAVTPAVRAAALANLGWDVVTH